MSGPKFGYERCADAHHTDDCLASCTAHPATCSIDRKHHRSGGVCCISCSDLCHGCDGVFYNEGLTRVGTYTNEDGDECDRYLCHCCMLEHFTAGVVA